MTDPDAIHEPSSDDLQQVEKLQTAYAAMKAEMRKVIVGQDEVVDELFMALFSRGHCLLIGVPGLNSAMNSSSTTSSWPTMTLRISAFIAA